MSNKSLDLWYFSEISLCWRYMDQAVTRLDRSNYLHFCFYGLVDSLTVRSQMNIQDRFHHNCLLMILLRPCHHCPTKILIAYWAIFALQFFLQYIFDVDWLWLTSAKMSASRDAPDSNALKQVCTENGYFSLGPHNFFIGGHPGGRERCLLKL